MEFLKLRKMIQDSIAVSQNEDHVRKKQKMEDDVIQKNVFLQLKESDPNRFLCTECNLKLPTHSDCINHINNHRFSALPKCVPNNEKTIMTCTICQQETTMTDDLLSHGWLDHGVFSKSNFKCPFCSLTVYSSIELLEHMDVTCIYFKCPKCSKICNQEHSYYTHLLSCFKIDSLAIMNHICDVCDKQVCLADVATHMIKHSIDMAKPTLELRRLNKVTPSELRKPILCEMCNMTFKKRRHFEAHMQAHYKVMPYVCKHCGRGYNHKTTAQVHLANYHNKPIKSDDINPADILQIRSCRVCKLSGFTKDSLLVRHFILVCQKTPEQALFSLALIKTAKKYNLSFMETLHSEYFQQSLDAGAHAYSSLPFVSNFLIMMKTASENPEEAVRIKQYTDVDLLCDIEMSDTTKSEENELENFLNFETKQELSEADMQTFMQYLHYIKDKESPKINQSLNDIKLNNFPGVSLLPEPDFNRLVYFYNLVKQQSPSNYTPEKIPNETLTRLNIEAQLLREMEPFYMEKSDHDYSADDTITPEVEELVELYNNKTYLENSLDNANDLLKHSDSI